MAAQDYSRAELKDFILSEDRLFNPVLDFTRSDEIAVDFTGKEIFMDIYTRRGTDYLVRLTSDSEIAIASARLSFNKLFTELEERTYRFRIYNNTDKIGIRRGKMHVL